MCLLFNVELSSTGCWKGSAGRFLSAPVAGQLLSQASSEMASASSSLVPSIDTSFLSIESSFLSAGVPHTLMTSGSDASCVVAGV